MSTIAIVGLGKIGQIHLDALEHVDLRCLGAVDPDPDREAVLRGASVPRLGTLEELLQTEPSIVVVATPTSTHAEVVGHILRSPDRPACVLVEKPLVASLSELRTVESLAGTTDGLQAAYHAAHAPEVIWAAAQLPAWRQVHGEITAFHASFADPYRHVDEPTRSRTYGTSWLDSGINSLSVLARFVHFHRITAVDPTDDGLTYRVALAGQDGSTEVGGTIDTTWDVDQPAKSTILHFESGAVLTLDHQRITAALTVGDTVLGSFESTSDWPRLTQHYVNLYRALLAEPAMGFTFAETRHLHDLLFSV